MANEIKGITIEFKGNTIDLENSISKLNKTMSALKSESRLLNKELKLDPSNAEKLNNVLKNLQNQQKILTQELKIYNNELDQLEAGSKEWLDMSKKIDQVQNALDRVNAQIKQLDNYNLQQLSKQFEKLGTTLNNVGQKITQVGQALTPLSTAAAGALGLAVKSAIDLEDAFAGVEKTVDGSADQLAALEQELRKMSTQAPVTAEEFAQIAENAGQLGIAIDDIAEFSEVMAGLGVATNLTSDEAATMIAQFANVVDIQGDYENFASALVKLGNDGASTEAEIMELAQRLSGAGAVADMSAQEILGLAASMANVGINAEAGGTAMSTLISQMEKAAVQGGESLGALASVAGMTASEFAAAWNDEPAIAIDAFLAGLNAIQQSGGNVYGTLENLGITEKRLTDTVLRLASANGEVAKNVDMANEAWAENTALQNEVDRAYGTTASKLETLWNSIKELARQIGETLLPQINGLIDRAQAFIDSLLGFNDATKEVKKGVGGMVKALAPFAEATAGISDETKEMIVKVGAAVAALAPAALTVGKVTDTFGDFFKVLGDADTLKSLKKGIEGLTSPLKTVSSAFGAVGKNLGKLFDSTSVGKAVKEVASMITGTFKNIPTAISSIFTQLTSPITNFFGGIWTQISGFMSKIGALLMQNPIVSTVVTKISALTSAFTPLMTALSSMAVPIGAIIALVIAAVAASEDLRKGLLALGKQILEGLKPVLDTIITVLQQIWNTVVTALWPAIQQFGDFLAVYIIPILQTLWSWFAENILPIVQKLIEIFGDAFCVAINIVSDALSGAVDWLSQLFQWLSDIWAWLGDLGVWDVFGQALDVVKGIVDNVIGAIQSLVSAVQDAWNAVSNFVSGVGSFFGGVIDGVGGFIDSILSGGFGDVAINSGGFASSGAAAINTTINVHTSQPITRAQVESWADIINEELGRRL